MARLLWLPEVLRAAGLTVSEYAGWKTRGASTFGPVEGIVCHHTGSSLKATDQGDLRQLAITGTPSAPEVPISQLFLSRSGTWWIVASGTATGVRTGTGGPLKGKGDDSVLQIEAQHGGGTEPWTPKQYQSYVRGCAALAKKLGIDVKFVIGHKEHQPGQKTDPTFNMATFRRDVTAAMIGKPEGEHDMWCVHGDKGNPADVNDKVGQNVAALQGDLEDAGADLSKVGGIDGSYGDGVAKAMVSVLGATVAGDGKAYGAKQRRALQNKLRGSVTGAPAPVLVPHTHTVPAQVSGPAVAA